MAIIKKHTALDGTLSIAEYSDCEKYRYSLARIWDPSKRPLAFMMLNPSTATEEQNDPTVARCEKRARMSGYGALYVFNIFAYRATDPKDMKAQANPVGRENNAYLFTAIKEYAAGKIDLVCGWGTHGAFRNREQEIFERFKMAGVNALALDWTKDGHPKHPLYISYENIAHRFGGAAD